MQFNFVHFFVIFYDLIKFFPEIFFCFVRACTKNQQFYFVSGFGYGHPNGLHPLMFNGWLDAAYMSYTFPEYFRQQPHNPQFAKGKYCYMMCDASFIDTQNTKSNRIELNQFGFVCNVNK